MATAGKDPGISRWAEGLAAEPGEVAGAGSGSADGADAGSGPLVGVVTLQGACLEHVRALRACGARVRPVRRPADLENLAGLVIPGGESTVIGRLMVETGILEPVKEAAGAGAGVPGPSGAPAGRLAVFGTCAGLVLLAKEISGEPSWVEPGSQPRLGLMDIRANRNAFGRQRESCEAELSVPVLGEPPVRAVFIRAPYIDFAGPGVEKLAFLGDKLVLARQGRFLAAAFHPELTGDLRVHRYFLEVVAGAA